MKKESLLMVASPMAYEMKMARLLANSAIHAFGNTNVYLRILDSDDDRGWPFGANLMFRESAKHLEEFFDDDFLWLEPDAVPMRPKWFSDIKRTYAAGRRPFMGELVTAYGTRPHMSGVGVYSRKWRSLAPALIEATDDAFDNWAGPQIVPQMYDSGLIQHIFYNPVMIGASMVRPNTMLFHQDKRGLLIKYLDKSLFGGELYKDQEDIVKESTVEPRFYHAENSNRVIKSGGTNFIFDPYSQFGGTWRGVYMTDRDSEIVSLNAVVSNQASGVTEISQSEYESKKKVIVPSSQVWPESPEMSKVQLKQSPAAVVVDPSQLPNPVIAAEAIQIDSVTPSVASPDKPPAPPPGKRQRRIK